MRGADFVRLLIRATKRLPGQAEFSGAGKLTIGQFESKTRLELLRYDIPVE